jgi:hypothetical protein
MLRHLVLDLFRRLWPVYAGTCAFLALFWATAGVFPFGPGFFFALSMAAIFVLGPLIALTQVAPMEVTLLPLPRRDLWRVTWLLGTVSACGAALIAKLAGVAAGSVLLTGGPLGLPQIAISSLVDFAYAGTVLGVLLLLRVGWSRSHGRIGRVVSAIAITLTIVTFAGGVLWGFLLQSYLPTEWAQLQGPAASLLTAATGIAFAAYFHVPPPGVRAPSRGSQTRARRTSTRAVYWPGGLTGLRLLLVHETLVTVAALLTTIGYMAALSSFIDPQHGLAEKLGAWRLLPFQSVDTSAAIFSLVIYGSVMLNANALAPAVNPSGSSPWRHLRVLPMSTMDLVRLLLLRRALGWLVIWTVLAIVHVAVTRALPATLRPELFALAVGADALIYAVQVRWQRHLLGIAYVAFYAGMMFLFGILLVLPLRLLSETWADTLLLPVGLGALVAAAWILRRTLQYSSKLYAPAPKVAPAGLL